LASNIKDIRRLRLDPLAQMEDIIGKQEQRQEDRDIELLTRLLFKKPSRLMAFLIHLMNEENSMQSSFDAKDKFRSSEAKTACHTFVDSDMVFSHPQTNFNTDKICAI
jgi:hypothetical protein